MHHFVTRGLAIVAVVMHTENRFTPAFVTVNHCHHSLFVFFVSFIFHLRADWFIWFHEVNIDDDNNDFLSRTRAAMSTRISRRTNTIVSIATEFFFNRMLHSSWTEYCMTVGPGTHIRCPDEEETKIPLSLWKQPTCALCWFCILVSYARVAQRRLADDSQKSWWSPAVTGNSHSQMLTATCAVRECGRNGRNNSRRHFSVPNLFRLISLMIPAHKLPDYRRVKFFENTFPFGLVGLSSFGCTAAQMCVSVRWWREWKEEGKKPHQNPV